MSEDKLCSLCMVCADTYPVLEEEFKQEDIDELRKTIKIEKEKILSEGGDIGEDYLYLVSRGLCEKHAIDVDDPTYYIVSCTNDEEGSPMPTGEYAIVNKEFVSNITNIEEPSFLTAITEKQYSELKKATDIRNSNFKTLLEKGVENKDQEVFIPLDKKSVN